MNKLLGFCLLLGFCACKDNEKTPTSGDTKDVIAPKTITYSLVTTLPHDTSSYTQGLVIYNGQLYEGTGLNGKSKLMKVDLATGKSLQKTDLSDKYFGEGVTILHDTVYQLTWQDKVVFMYSLKDFKLLKEFPIYTDGWGITTDGRELIVSDGTSNLTFYEPGTFKKLRTVSITESGSFVNMVNELEFINGYVYANKYQTDQVLKIDPVTGIVVGKADFSDLANKVRARYPFVDYFNGIAYDSSSKKIFVTGKLWPEMYEVRFSE